MGEDRPKSEWGVTGPEKEIASPWPDLDRHLHLRRMHVVGIGAPAQSEEAATGYALARYVAANGIRTLLFAPYLTTPQPTWNLHIQRGGRLHIRGIRRAVENFAHTSQPVGLVVIDAFHLMCTGEDEGRVRHPEQARELGRQLKMLAISPDHHQPPVVVMAHLDTPADGQRPVRLDDLGLAAELEYDADTLLLLRRTAPQNVDVLVAKDRHGPAPDKSALAW